MPTITKVGDAVRKACRKRENSVLVHFSVDSVVFAEPGKFHARLLVHQLEMLFVDRIQL